MNPRTQCNNLRTALGWAAIGIALGFAGCTTAAFRGGDAVAEAPADSQPVKRSSMRDRTADAYYRYAAAQLLARQDRLDEAIGEIRLAINDDPTTALLWIQLEQWLLRTGNIPGALDAAQKAVALEPSSSAARLILADLYRHQKRFADAERELGQAIAQQPQSPEPYLALAQQYFEQKAYDKARTVLLQLLAARPNDAQAHYFLGRGAIETENWDEAIAELRRATELDPDHDASWSALGYVYETRDQPEQAVQIYKQAIKANPDNAGFVERLGEARIVRI